MYNKHKFLIAPNFLFFHKSKIIIKNHDEVLISPKWCDFINLRSNLDVALLFRMSSAERKSYKGRESMREREGERDEEKKGI